MWPLCWLACDRVGPMGGTNQPEQRGESPTIGLQPPLLSAGSPRPFPQDLTHLPIPRAPIRGEEPAMERVDEPAHHLRLPALGPLHPV